MGKLVQPPYSNRGVERTTETGLRPCVDWLQVTFKNVRTAQQICEVIGLEFDDFTHVENSGKYGYAHHYRLGNIAIYYSDDLDHLHLEITGQGCRMYEHISKYDWSVLFGLLLMLDVNVTRLDLALDDFEGYFNLDQVKRKVKLGHIKSRFRKARILDEYELGEGQLTGETVYFGSPKSDIQVRMYNKKQERESEKKVVTVDHWVRTELQLRDDNAKHALTVIADNELNESIGAYIKGKLKNYLSFLVENKSDSNKRRWKVCKWWERYLGDVEKVKLCKVAPDATVERAKNWLETSVAPNLITVLQAHDYDFEVLYELITKGIKKQNKKHKIMLDSYRKINGKADLKKQQFNKEKLYKLMFDNKKDLNRGTI